MPSARAAIAIAVKPAFFRMERTEWRKSAITASMQNHDEIATAEFHQSRCDAMEGGLEPARGFSLAVTGFSLWLAFLHFA
jgi:hypothetical protein